jgi:hypothetical protein
MKRYQAGIWGINIHPELLLQFRGPPMRPHQSGAVAIIVVEKSKWMSCPILFPEMYLRILEYV